MTAPRTGASDHNLEPKGKALEAKDKVKWIYSSKDKTELEKRYDQWAGEYDRDLCDAFGWRGPALTADVFARHVDREALILDAGCGTGLMGLALAEQGWKRLEALDLSEGMLEEARKKNIYSAFHQGALGEPLNLPSDKYDAVVSCGVFTVGHVGPEGFDELIRATRPGGKIIFTLRPDTYLEEGFKEKFKSLEQSGLWREAEVTEPAQCLPEGEPEVLHSVFVFQVN